MCIVRAMLRRISRCELVPSAMESPESRFAKQAVEDVSHLVEEGDNIVMPHQCGLSWRRLGEVGHHRCQRIVSRPVRFGVAVVQWPDCCM